MRKLLMIIALMVIFASSFSQTVEQVLAKKVMALNGNEDFKALDDALKDKRLIILGEASHYDRTTFEVKIKLIKYLQKKFNFNVLGLEAFDYIESMVVQEKCEQITSAKFDINRFWIPLWTTPNECQPLISMIKNKEIEIFGIDCNPRLYTIDCLKQLLIDIDSKNVNLVDWDRVKTIFRKLFHRKFFDDLTILTNGEHVYFLDVINRLNNYGDKLSRSKNSKSLDLFKQSVRNLKSVYNMEFVAKADEDIHNDNNAMVISNNIRDRQMAENIIHYMKLNPEKKVIIWSANFHGARDISQTIFPKEITMYARTKLMGEHLSEAFGDQLYSLAFTSPNNHKDALESYIANENIDFGFIDFLPLKYSNEFFDKAFKSNVIGHKSGKWMSIFDGIYFIKNQKKVY